MTEYESAFRRQMRASDWTFALALPTTERGFRRARSVGEYCVKYDDWSSYERRFLSQFRKYIVPLKCEAGLTILEGVSSRQYARALNGQFGVVLYSHCNYDKGRIEFSEGMVPYDRPVASVQRDFCGIADLSVCNPVGFECALRARAPRCVVKITLAELDPTEWLKFYGYLFAELASNELSYAEAILRTCALFGIPA